MKLGYTICMTHTTHTAQAPPVAPLTPDINDCCLSGCIPCIFDQYDEALARYRLELQAWQQRQAEAAAQAPLP